MNENQKEVEKERPERLTVDKFVFMNRYQD